MSEAENPQISPLRYALSKNISTKGPLNCRSLGFARDDKGKGDGSIERGCWTANLRHAGKCDLLRLRVGRDSSGFRKTLPRITGMSPQV